MTRKTGNNHDKQAPCHSQRHFMALRHMLCSPVCVVASQATPPHPYPHSSVSHDSGVAANKSILFICCCGLQRVLTQSRTKSNSTQLTYAFSLISIMSSRVSNKFRHGYGLCRSLCSSQHATCIKPTSECPDATKRERVPRVLFLNATIFSQVLCFRVILAFLHVRCSFSAKFSNSSPKAYNNPKQKKQKSD